MHRPALALLALALSACAGTTAGTSPTRSTTSVSMPAGGPQGSVGTGSVSVTTHADAGPSVAELTVSADAAFQALPQVYQDLGIPMGTQDPAQRLFGNRKVQVSRRLGRQPLSRVVNCGNTAFGAPVADSYRVQLSIVSTVRPEGSGSRLETRVEASAAQPGVSGAPVACASTGWLEERIATGVRVRTTT